MPGHHDTANRRGWLPPELWLKIVDDHTPPARLRAMMDIVPDEAYDAIDPYILSSLSCLDYDGLLMRQDLANVNGQLRALLHGTYLHPLDCLVVTANNIRSLRRRLKKASS